jgi:hypothetical protein
MQINQNVLAVLSAATTLGNTVALNGQLDRGLYTQVNKVLESAGGKWDRKVKAHVFLGDAAERIDQIIVSGCIDIPKDDFEFIPTPAAAVDRVHELADLHSNMIVLEPSAGRAAMVERCKQFQFIHCIEKMPANAQYLRELGWLDSVIEADFLDVLPAPNFDRVLMNPPFSKGQDIKHVTHAIGFLKPGGRLVAIMGAGVTFRQDKRTTEFRELVQSMGGSIEPLPEGSFKSSGTMVNTVIVTLDFLPSSIIQ